VDEDTPEGAAPGPCEDKAPCGQESGQTGPPLPEASAPSAGEAKSEEAGRKRRERGRKGKEDPPARPEPARTPETASAPAPATPEPARPPRAEAKGGGKGKDAPAKKPPSKAPQPKSAPEPAPEPKPARRAAKAAWAPTVNRWAETDRPADIIAPHARATPAKSVQTPKPKQPPPPSPAEKDQCAKPAGGKERALQTPTTPPPTTLSAAALSAGTTTPPCPPPPGLCVDNSPPLSTTVRTTPHVVDLGATQVCPLPLQHLLAQDRWQVGRVGASSHKPLFWGWGAEGWSDEPVVHASSDDTAEPELEPDTDCLPEGVTRVHRFWSAKGQGELSVQPGDVVQLHGSGFNGAWSYGVLVGGPCEGSAGYFPDECLKAV